ncbi:density-regulated protein homolog isoform X2 [Belonocnema kinseyi]|uniref:density-regulated protein homolog isoform X2 n=1 Tax=Belonocnema kinseyi TaxID=2817044 RepID=UPI00143DAD5B|nr:density-regulated protein homolog isoform X2 [Belonocnema kinseyi]
MAELEKQTDLRLGPDPHAIYPIQVQYCGNCSLPIEVLYVIDCNWAGSDSFFALYQSYCEYYPEYEKCKQWLERNLPSEFEKVKLADEGTTEVGGEDEKKRQKRGGKGMLKTKKKDDIPKLVTVSRAPRGKKKSVTVVTGLSTFDIDLKVAAKFFGSKFACGSSVTGDDEIVIQGDVKDDLFEVIPEKWPQIDEDSIDDLGDQKR